MKKIVLVMALLLSAVSFGQIDVSPTTFHNGINLPNAVEDAAPDSLLTITGEGEVQYVLKSSIQADETDPVYLAEPASNITSTDITNWNASEPNVQSDWNAISGDAAILNKPVVPTDNTQIANGAGYITNYSLPIASATTLGGVKVGDGLSIDVSGLIKAEAPLVEVTEGGNTGYRIKGFDPANYGDIGNKAIDLSYSPLAGSYGATGGYSFASGIYTTSSGNYSFSGGNGATASGNYSFSFGSSTVASGNNSFAVGNETLASGVASFASGDRSQALGWYSTAIGILVTSESYKEITLGASDTNYTVNSVYDWNTGDRLFTIGNGEGDTQRSDAFTILKNGQTAIGIDNFEANTTGELLQVNGKVKATQYKLSVLNTAPTSATDTGETGEIRITSDYIYVCIATNTWVRAALTTW